MRFVGLVLVGFGLGSCLLTSVPAASAAPLVAAPSWIPAVDLSTRSRFLPFEPYPEIAMGAAGGAVAVWSQFEDFENVQAASMTPAGTWGTPVDLAPGVHDQRAPQVAMNQAGEAVAVWEQLGEQAPVAAAVRTPFGQWGPPETLSPEGSVFTDIDVAVGPAGEAVAVWSENPRFTSSSGYRIEGSFRPAGGHWEAPVAISGVGYQSSSPQVAIAPTGHIVVTWCGSYNGNNESTVQVAEGQGGSWSEPQALSNGRSASSPKVEVGAAGAAVIWESEEGWIEAAGHAAGTKWGKPVTLSGPESIEPQIGADAAGNAVAIWSSGYGEEGEYIESSTLPVGGVWSEPVEVSGAVLVESTEPQLAVAPNGETLATWSTWHDQERFVEEASGVGGEWEEPTTLSAVGTWAMRAVVALDGQGDGAVAWWAASPVLPQATEFVAPRPSATSSEGQVPSSSGQSSTSNAVPGLTSRAKVRRVAFVKKNKVYVELRCPGTGGCEGDLHLITSVAGKNAEAAPVSSGSVNFTIPAGGEKTVVIRLNPTGRRLFSLAGKKGFGVRLLGEGVERSHLLLRSEEGRPRSP